MRPIFPRPSLRSRLGFACALLAAGGLLGACDKHSADEIPESYGHGSSHAKSYSNHQLDSRKESASFSDSAGMEAGREHEGAEHKAAPGESPKPSEPGRFFPSGS